MREILLKDGESCVSYHEYAVFSPPDGLTDGELRSPSIMSEGEEGLRMFRDAVRNGHGLDNEGNFTANPKGKRSLHGRVRQIIAQRRTSHRMIDGIGNVPDGLDLTVEDYETLGLHPATLPGLTRVTSESSFWDAKRESFHLILSFSSNPQPPYDFLSMRYNLRAKSTNALIRRSFDTRWHDEDALDEYERRFDSCRARWAHPLVLPIVLLQVQLLRTEEAVIANNSEVLLLEERVDAVTGTTGQANAEAYKLNGAKKKLRPPHLRPLKRLSSLKEYVEEKVGYGTRDHSGPSVASPVASLYDPEYVPPQTIYLMKEAHDVLKGSIQLLDTLRWMERAVKLLIQVGDDLDARVNDPKAKVPLKVEPKQSDEGSSDDLSFHWHEIRQYLDCIWRLCTSLETDRRMSELRCRAQIDIVYSLMAQEDNNLNARQNGGSINTRQFFNESARSDHSDIPSRGIHRDVIRDVHVQLAERDSRRSGREQGRRREPTIPHNHAFILDLLGLHNPAHAADPISLAWLVGKPRQVFPPTSEQRAQQRAVLDARWQAAAPRDVLQAGFLLVVQLEWREEYH
ncbi:hypothetical protein O1611_g384 [Lasiodiplodia mahajangana]|uniref:Uncharacterized protein n=1 Tax=Lasiodiplodia mahajangana TaxID=1108764 RepID=A0ACC2K1B6_9PEZI|nr:hypothetical protein O1611_g384 [Lasiodiplodia mahajangana]